MSQSCACDVCDVTFGPRDMRTADGLCSFCAERCFPTSDNGTVIRMSTRSRAMIHRKQDRPPPPSGYDNQREYADQKDVVSLIAQEAADIFLPVIVPKMSSALQKILRKVGR